MPANTPADARDAINAYTGAILTYGADLGWQSPDTLNIHVHTVDAAVASSTRPTPEQTKPKA
jgi:hypothetical protein